MLSHSPPAMDTRQAVWQETRQIHALNQACLLGLYLNSQYQLLNKKILALGLKQQLGITSREILAPAIALPAPFLILVNHHLLGDTRINVRDLALAKQTVLAAQNLEITLLDYLVVSTTGFSSCPLPVSVT